MHYSGDTHTHARSCHLNNAESSGRINGQRDDAVTSALSDGKLSELAIKGDAVSGGTMSLGNQSVSWVGGEVNMPPQPDVRAPLDPLHK